MIQQKLQLGAQARARTALLLGALVAAAALGLATKAPTAQATYFEEKYGGCTYSWGAPCYIWTGAMNFLITMDPDHAVELMGAERATFNGYKKAKHDGIERDVCGTIFAKIGGPEDYPWTCNWGRTIVTYPETYGISTIGGANYSQIALYDVAGWGNQ